MPLGYSIRRRYTEQEEPTMHARVAFYTLRSGSLDDAGRTVEAPGALMCISSGQPGFRSYALIDAGAGLISVSRWESSEQAQAATEGAAAWVEEDSGEPVTVPQCNTREIPQ